MKGHGGGTDETASTPVLPCANTPPCMGGPGLICPECPFRPAGWAAQTLAGEPAAPPRCPRDLGATCAADVACVCREAKRATDAWLAPIVAALPRETDAPPAVHDTLRREALDRAAKALPPTATPAELVAGAYLIGRFLDVGLA